MLEDFELKSLKTMSDADLNELAKEIRDEIINVTSVNGGHLGSNLGVVELTIALHKVFDSPKDKIIFDVSHQTYTHKLLTGRKDEFATLRKFKGLSGFAKMSESEHDVFEAGHSSTSISAGLGFLEAKKRGKTDIGDVICVIGDASVSNGLSFEALNYLGAHPEEKMIIIINDNNMSVSKNVGALAKRYNKIRTVKGLNLLKKVVPIRIKHALQYYAYKVDLFTSLGFKYFENIDGHDINELVRYLTYAKSSSKSVVLHIKTTKGKGYKPAEDDILGDWHGVGPFNIETGTILNNKQNDTFGEAISNELIKQCDQGDNNIIILTAAMGLGCGLKKFNEKYPEKVIDVGIAEENAVVMASSFAINKMKPVVFMYATFIQRAFDEIIHDVARTSTHVVFCIDHAGIVPGDGNTHQGIYDLAMFNAIPGLVIFAPTTLGDATKMLNYALNKMDGPAVIRYPKGEGINNNIYFNDDLSWNVIINNDEEFIISYGPIITTIKEKIEKEQINIGLIDALTINPLDETLIASLNNKKLYIFEEVIENGSLASNILLLINKLDLNIKVKIITLKNEYVDEGKVDELRKNHHVSIDDLFNVVKEGK